MGPIKHVKWGLQGHCGCSVSALMPLGITGEGVVTDCSEFEKCVRDDELTLKMVNFQPDCKLASKAVETRR